MALTLPKRIAYALDEKRIELSAAGGVPLSHAQTVAYLIKFHTERSAEFAREQQE